MPRPARYSPDGVGPPLAERQVVLGRADVAGVALDVDSRRSGSACMASNTSSSSRRRRRPQVEAVELEVHVLEGDLPRRLRGRLDDLNGHRLRDRSAAAVADRHRHRHRPAPYPVRTPALCRLVARPEQLARRTVPAIGQRASPSGSRRVGAELGLFAHAHLARIAGDRDRRRPVRGWRRSWLRASGGGGMCRRTPEWYPRRNSAPTRSPSARRQAATGVRAGAVHSGPGQAGTGE